MKTPSNPAPHPAPDAASQPPSLFQYLDAAFKKDIVHHALGVMLQPDGGYHFYIHPAAVSGETEDYLVWPDPFNETTDLLMNKKRVPEPDVKAFLAKLKQHREDAASQPAVPDAPTPLRNPAIFPPTSLPTDDWMHAGHYEELKVWANRRINVLERELAAALAENERFAKMAVGLAVANCHEEIEELRAQLEKYRKTSKMTEAELATLRQPPASDPAQELLEEAGRLANARTKLKAARGFLLDVLAYFEDATSDLDNKGTYYVEIPHDEYEASLVPFLKRIEAFLGSPESTQPPAPGASAAVREKVRGIVLCLQHDETFSCDDATDRILSLFPKTALAPPVTNAPCSDFTSASSQEAIRVMNEVGDKLTIEALAPANGDAGAEDSARKGSDA